MSLPTIDSLEISNKRVLLRADLDINRQGKKLIETDRLEKLLPTLNKLLEKNAQKIVIIGHSGRPKNQEKELSLKPFTNYFSEKLNQEVGFLENPNTPLPEQKIIILENLRFNKGEVKNSQEFSQALSELADVYINDSFGASHREHASIIGLPNLLPHAAGLHFIDEINSLNKITKNPARPVVVLISGVKKDKLNYLEHLKRFADKILISGRLPKLLPEDTVDEKLIIAKLTQDNEDITIKTMEIFEAEIKKAKTILLSGPTGKFEEEGHRLGTKRVFEAVANSGAVKLAGGGDTTAAIDLLGLREKFDWISTGGGAMLEFLAKGTLPGIKALEVKGFSA